jgi:glutaredoxin-like YruB-family protein
MDVKIYSTPTCGYCTRAKSYLSSKAIAFQDIDVSKDQDARQEMVKISGQMGVPVIVVNGTVIRGFDQEQLDKLIGAGK